MKFGFGCQRRRCSSSGLVSVGFVSGLPSAFRQGGVRGRIDQAESVLFREKRVLDT